jgi:type III secretion protein V
MSSKSFGGSDLALGAFVVAIVAMMIVPLPTFVLDILISANICLSVILLMVGVYASSAMRITAFPTMLLLATLFRLGLNITSARLILAQADAGEVIRAFGTAVVKGSLVVGVIVFVIITIVQYVVIARGAERVAEVAARFTLDAMPGKQMAIDADMRAGTIDPAEAQRQRKTLSREAQLYGAMDGAMRFVKGDAIAGMLILVVCIGGGVVVGVAQRGLSLDEAFRVYALLTIGDGLVSQIPALVTSTAAGLVVTRVASEDEDTHLGQEISAQVLAHPRAIGMTAAMLFLLSLVPGLPKLPFWILAAVAGAVAWGVAASRRRSARARSVDAPSAVLRVETDGAVADLESDLGRWLGVQLPVATTPRGAAGWRLRVSAVPVAEGTEPEALAAALRRHAHEALGIQEVQGLLDALAAEQPALVREVVPRTIALPTLTEVLRRLLAEGVPIRDLRTILGALAGAADKDADALTERARAALRRAITYQLTDGKGVLSALVLDGLVSDAIGDGVVRGGNGTQLALEPDLARDILTAVARATAGGARVLVTSSRIRRFARALVADRFPDLQVVSYDELLPEIQIEPAGRVTVS